MSELARVLVAGDSPAAVEELATILNQAGRLALVAVDSNAVQTKIEAASDSALFEAILVDDGGAALASDDSGDRLDPAALAEKLTDRFGPSAPAVVWHTALAPEDLVLQALARGVRDVVRPSASARELARRLESAARGVREVRRLETALKALEEQNGIHEERTRFHLELLASVSHEIRTPLTSVVGYADILLDAEASAAQRREWVQTIRRSGRHLMEVVDDVLDLAKLETGKLSVERSSLSVPSVLEEVRKLMLPRAREKKLGLELALESPVPETVESDPTRVRQVLVNLVGNAIKFTDRGNVRIACWLDGPATNPKLVFEVSDTGPGLAPEELNDLFVPYRRLGSRGELDRGGSGLGLAISRRLAHLLGGEIEVKSTKGAGSTFTFSIATGPIDDRQLIREIDREKLRRLADESRRARRTSQRLSGRVLLAEDVAANRALIAYYLRLAGLDVELASDGEEAIACVHAAHAAGRPFDLVLMDMELPTVDGWTATARLREAGYELPIVALTAHTFPDEREKCLRAGCNEFASKPIDQKTLIEAVSRSLAPDRGARTADRPSPSSTQPLAPELDSSPHSAPDGDEPLRLVEDRPVGSPALLYSTLLAADEPVDPELIRLVEAFVNDLPNRIERIALLAKSSDDLELLRAVHELKGAAGSYGYLALGEALEEIEHHTRSRDRTALANVLDEIRELAERVRVARAAPVED